jgi:hypothetical protein
MSADLSQKTLQMSQKFFKRTTLTGVLHHRVRKERELFLLMRLSKQLGQIFQLVDDFHDDTSYPVRVTVDECWIYTGDVACIRKFLLSAGPSFVQCGDGCDKLSDGVGVIVLDGIMADFYCQLLV